MAGNIPLPKTPDVKSATGFSQVDPRTGTAPARALVGLGNAIAQTGKTFDMFAEKKQKVLNSGAESAQDLAVLQAKGKIANFTEENQDDPDAITQFSSDTMSGVLDNPKYLKAVAKADEETQGKLLDKFRYQSERGRLETQGVTIKIEVANANTEIMNAAQMMIDQGDIQGGITKSGEASMSDGKREDWIVARVRENLYSKLDMHLTGLETPDEFREFQEGILNKDTNGLYDKYVTNYDITRQGKEEEVMEISGLSSPQREHLASLAYKKERRVLSQQSSNLKADLKLAARGDPEALANMEVRILEEGKLGYPESSRDGIEDKIAKSMRKHREGESLKTMVAAAKTGKSKKKYRQMEVDLAAALFDPTGFDVKQMGEDIDDLDIAPPVKLQLLGSALSIASEQYEEEPPEDRVRPAAPRAFMISPVSVAFIWAYRNTFGKQKLTPAEAKTLSRSYSVMSKAVKTMGKWDGLPDELDRVQQGIYDFYEDNENPSNKEILEFEKSLFAPLEEKEVTHVMRGDEKAAAPTPKQQEALDWLKENPDDPSAAALYSHLRKLGLI